MGDPRRRARQPYDPYAVAVYLAGRLVGHLPREEAAFWPLIDRISAAGRLACCRADIYVGGNRSATDRGDYSVTLYAAGPEAQTAKLARELDRKTRAEIAGETPPLAPGREKGPAMVRGRYHSAWHPEVKRLRDSRSDTPRP